jgi:2',3'-cyclic-nucleotide 2'-phosphodiesterase/3'-nucleotidase
MLFHAALAVLLVQTPDTARVVVVATADLHGQAVSWDFSRAAPVPGGLARAATIIDSLRRVYPDRVIVVDAGGAIQGSPLATYYGSVAPQDPHPIIDAMNLIGYDAATPGADEFAFGLGLMNRTLSAATFPFVSGNLRVIPDDTLALRPYVVLQRGGVRVGIAGFTTPGVMVWNRSAVRGHLSVTPIERESKGVLRELRRDADFAIVLAHSGLSGPSSYDTTGVGAENSAALLAEGAVLPDLVIVAHGQREIVDSVIQGVHFVEPKPFAQSLAVVHVTLVRREGQWRPLRIRAERVPLDAVAPSARVQRRLADKQAPVTNWLTQNLGELSAPMRAASGRVEDTPLIRFINDVQRRAAKADLSATPVFDIRTGLDAGEVTVADVYQLYPADYTLRAVRISGEGLKAYLEQAARYWYVDSTGAVFTNAFVPGPQYDVIGGAEYAIDLSLPAGGRITGLTVKGKPVEPSDSFTLALNSYRQSGGGNYAALRDAPVTYDRGESVRDLLIADIRRRRTLDPATFAGTSWRLVPEASALAARALFIRPGGPAPLAPTVAAGAFLLPPPPPRDRDTLDLVLSPGDATIATLRLPASAGPGGSLLRLLADAYRTALRADLAIVAADEGAQTLADGSVTEESLRAAVPGGNRLLRITMRGDDLRWVFEHLVEHEVPCCEIGGATLTYAPGRKAFDRVKAVRFSGGRELESKHTYLVVISERLVQDDTFVLGGTRCGAGGLGCSTSGLLGRWPVTHSDLTGTDALRDYLRRLTQPVVPPESPRLLPAR